MTNTTPNTFAAAPALPSGNRPTHIVRKKSEQGRKADFETLGVAWAREDGSLYLKLYGTQIVDGGFYIFPNRNDNPEAGQ